ncbi:MAG: hypothetical protein J7L34_03535 [Thermotogaceae bacterium]|nr:hypothetical protein [Thermotogaceae bacterium]
MKVGFSKASLDVPIGMEMAGYVNRKGVSKGFLKPLEAFCVLLEDNNIKLAILTFDILGIPDGFPCIISGWKTIPVATHTHSAPVPSEIKDELLNTASKLIEKAKHNLYDVKEILFKKFTVKGVCAQRRRGESLGELKGYMIHIKSLKNISFVIFPCHPTVLGPENLFYSPDLAGAIRQELSKMFDSEVIYMNSCAGNVSTRKTRKERNEKEIERLSKMFACNIDVLSSKSIAPKIEDFKEIFVSLKTVKKSSEKIDEDTKTALKLLALRKNMDGKILRICSFKLGKVPFVFHPFEMFYKRCEELDILLIGYACSYGSYLVPNDVKDGYEWIASPYSSSTEQNIVNLIKDLIR